MADRRLAAGARVYVEGVGLGRVVGFYTQPGQVRGFGFRVTEQQFVRVRTDSGSYGLYDPRAVTPCHDDE